MWLSLCHAQKTGDGHDIVSRLMLKHEAPRGSLAPALWSASRMLFACRLVRKGGHQACKAGVQLTESWLSLGLLGCLFVSPDMP